MFKHVKGDAPFKLVAQYRKGEWRVNLHEPDKLQQKEIPYRGVSHVTIRTGEWTMVKGGSCGTKPYDAFFNRYLPERIRDAAFRITLQSLLDNAISEREAALAEAA